MDVARTRFTSVARKLLGGYNPPSPHGSYMIRDGMRTHIIYGVWYVCVSVYITLHYRSNDHVLPWYFAI